MSSADLLRGVARPADGPPTFEARGVSKTYGAVQALRDVTIRLHAGSVTALVGENGAGKSTLSSIIAGLTRPDSGELLLDGARLDLENPQQAHIAGIRIAPQELVLCENLTVAENICMGALPGPSMWFSRSDMLQIATERLALLGVSHIDPRALLSSLSLVGKTLVQIARALAPGARVLVVDEPTAPMTTGEAEQFLQVVRRVTNGGVATVYVSHHLEEVFRLADVAAVLRDGRVVAEFAGDDLTHAALIDAMVGGRSLTVHAANGDPGGFVLRCRDLSSGALRTASFDVRSGEIVSVYGIAGSGREDLGASIVGSHASPRAGVVEVPGAGQVRSIGEALKCGIGYVPPERRSQGLVLDMSVRENLTLSVLDAVSSWGIFNREAERGVAQNWISRLSIATPSPEKSIALLSGGSQQKVLLARALAAGGKILVLEEPTRGVDIATKAEIHRLLRDVADAGSGVLVISSDLEEVVAVADRVLVMRGGRIVSEQVNPTQESVAAAALIDLPADPSVPVSDSNESNVNAGNQS